MKVKEIVSKVACGVSLPVYLQNGISGDPRKVEQADYYGGNYTEMNKTVLSVIVGNNGLTIFYK